MSLLHTSSKLARNALRSDAATPRLQGRTLLLARMIWIAGVTAVLVIFFASIPAYFTALHTISSTGLGLRGQQLTPAGVRQLHALGLSLDFYAAFLVASNVIFVLVWFAVGGLIFWRKADERMAFFASFTLMMFPVGFGYWTQALPSNWWLPVQSIRFLGGMSLSLFLIVFPDGRFVPRWTRWLLLGWVVQECNDTFFASASFNPLYRFPLLGLLLFVGVLLSAGGVQIYHYRRASNPLQRQQTKWVFFGVALTCVGFATSILVSTLFVPVDAQTGPLANMVGNSIVNFCLLLVPLSIGLAILRSRLWDIDVIINRSLVYGLLTATLALVYTGLVIALQSLVRAVTGQAAQQPLIIVGSTLVIAAIFQPLRRRIQSIIDRRFYRRKYDAARTLAAFSATLRNEVDLNQLSEHLVAVVQETMQPAHVSLWLRQPSQERQSDT